MAGILKVKVGEQWLDIPAIVGPQGVPGPKGDPGDVQVLIDLGLYVSDGKIMCTFEEE